MLVTSGVLWAYHGVLWSGPEMYPWGSDTWSHLFKAIYLYREIGQGNWYPNLLPAWYMGLEMLRYHAPLTYYLLAGLYGLTGDIFRSANLFLFLSAWTGAQSVLLFRRWIGWGPATIAGVLYAWLPDQLRVAFAEGNLPRALASTFLPLALFCLLLILFGDTQHRARSRFAAFAGLSIALALVVLSHAMMGAIFAVSLGGIALLAFAFGAVRARAFWTGFAGILTGLGLAAWWLVPSLSGGIGDINPNALSEAVARFSPTISLNPMLRLSNPEAFYLSLALCAAAVVSLFQWSRLTPLARVLLVSGLLTAAVTFDGVYDLYSALPLHQELWPIRFTTFSGPALLLGVAASVGAWRWRPLALLAVLAIALDMSPSLALAHTNPLPSDLVQVAESLRGLPGWRVAVADSSRLGSKPSYLLSEVAGREQVYGWAYQGARTARLVAALNEAMEQGFTGYALDRLNLMGADDVLVAPTLPSASELENALGSAGWAFEKQFDSGQLYHRTGGPRATRLDGAILGIGAGAYEAALIFPSILAGGSAYADDYQPGDLAPYPALYLSHFTWHDQTHAEDLLRTYARSGGRVIIDLNSAPEDSLARVPKFLGVYGEPVMLQEAVTLSDREGNHQLLPFGSPVSPWHAYSPQGNLVPLSTFNYMGQTAIGVGFYDEGAGRITFLGLNLPYHSLQTHDPETIHILESVFGMKAEQPQARPTVPLDGYHADVSGYRFSYDLDRESWVLLPVAHLDGIRASLDGKPLATMALDTLVAFRAPAGQHKVTLTMTTTPLHLAGAVMSLMAAIGLIAFAVARGLRGKRWRSLFKPLRRAAAISGAGMLLWLALATAAYAAAIAIDGNFGDWAGQANITDPQGDATDPDADIAALYWANNPGDPTMYWMIERYPPKTSQRITYLLQLDTNNDGTYDQTVTITYQANTSNASVTVDHGGVGAGETRDAGGRRVEIGVPFSSLGIAPGSVIRFYLQSETGSKVCDSTSSVQVSAVSVLEIPTLAVLTVLVILGVWWFAGRSRWTS